MVKGRKKSITLNYVEIIIEINGRQKRVAELPHLHEFLPEGTGWKFKQDEALYDTIAEIYKYYYDRALDKENS